MYFVLLGVLLLGLKLAEVGPVGLWSWWIVLAPFACAAAWWAWADASGYYKRRAIEGMEAKKAARRRRNLEVLRAGTKHKS
jgi:small Trp-rich protein